jgi:hypothetical protein
MPHLCRDRNGTKNVTARSRLGLILRILSHIMRGAFVVQLGPETRPAEGRFEGWVEEVDSCTELRFRTAEELLQFLGQRFTATMALASKNSKERQKAQAVLDKYKPCKEEDLVIRPSEKSKRYTGGK